MYYSSQSAPEHRIIEGLDRAGICEQYQGKVLFLAKRLADRLPMGCSMTAEDLASYGAIGLLEAFEHFDESFNIRFGTYAEYRIRGAMLDTLRSLDTLSRRQRNIAREIEDARDSLTLEHGRPPSPEEIAERLDMDMDSYWDAADQVSPITHMSLENQESVNDGAQGGSKLLDSRLHHDGEEVLLSLASKDTRAMLMKAVLMLPERKRQCVMLYYGRGLSLAEIGETYSVSVSRISQILSEARKTLRKSIKEFIKAQDLDWREAI